MTNSYLKIALPVALAATAACNRDVKEPSAPLSIRLTSTSFSNETLKKALTCDGPGVSPQLSWTDPPPGTRSFAIVATDIDAPFGMKFVHWVIYNIPPDVRELPENVPLQNSLPNEIEQGPNDTGKPGYTPACPPNGSHRYDFVLYAVDRKVNIQFASKKQLLDAIGGHVLAKGDLVGRYKR